VKAARAGRSSVRIAAGKWKGRRLPVPKGARPTSSRAREALFDLLGERIAGARVLDLFAGSGAVGFEAVSRGASRAVLVERDAEALRRARETFGAGDAVAVLASDAAGAVASLESAGERFDVVFADPPYGSQPRSAEALASAAALLSPGGILVFQSDADAAPPAVEGLEAFSRRAYGRNVFHFLRVL